MASLLSLDARSNLEQLITSTAIAPEGDGWAHIYREGNLSAAARDVENSLSKPGDLESLRLWWVLIQLRLELVPATVLVGSLDEVAAGQRVRADLSQLYSHVVLKLGLRLWERGQSRLGLAVLGRMLETNALGGLLLSGPSRMTYARIMKGLIAVERHESQARRESPKYLDSLSEREKQIDALLEVEAKQQQEKREARAMAQSATRQTGSFTSKDLLAGLSGSPLATQSVASTGPKSFVLGEKSGDADAAITPAESKRVPTSWLVALVIIFSAVSGLVYWQRQQSIFPSEFDNRLAQMGIQSDPPKLEIPAIDPYVVGAKSVGANEDFDEIAKRLDRISSASSVQVMESSSAPTSGPPGEAPDPRGNVLAGSNSPEPASGQDNPPNDRRRPDRDTSAGQNSSVPLYPPQLEAQLPPGMKIPAGREGSLKVGPDGRVYGPPPEGPPRDQDVGNRPPSSRAPQTLDGGPLREYIVEQFPQPKRYRVIASTDVLSRPSVFAYRLSRLERDAEVVAVARMGGWLELEPRRGVPGYIFAQDASPTE